MLFVIANDWNQLKGLRGRTGEVNCDTPSPCNYQKQIEQVLDAQPSKGQKGVRCMLRFVLKHKAEMFGGRKEYAFRLSP